MPKVCFHLNELLLINYHIISFEIRNTAIAACYRTANKLLERMARCVCRENIPGAYRVR